MTGKKRNFDFNFHLSFEFINTHLFLFNSFKIYFKRDFSENSKFIAIFVFNAAGFALPLARLMVQLLRA